MKHMTAAGMLGVLVLLALGSLPALGGEREGTLPDELAAHKPPAPNDIYVAVLPFWTRNEEQSDVARAAIMLNLMRHGFRMAPQGCRSLAEVIRKADTALRRDPEWDPLARMDEKDAARVGRALGADWVMFGEFGDLRVESKGGGILPTKVGHADIRFVLVEAKSGKTLYWRRLGDSEESGGGGAWPAKASSIERKLVTRAINEVFEDISAAVPEHYAGPEVTAEEVRRLLDAMNK